MSISISYTISNDNILTLVAEETSAPPSDADGKAPDTIYMELKLTEGTLGSEINTQTFSGSSPIKGKIVYPITCTEEKNFVGIASIIKSRTLETIDGGSIQIPFKPKPIVYMKTPVFHLQMQSAQKESANGINVFLQVELCAAEDYTLINVLKDSVKVRFFLSNEIPAFLPLTGITEEHTCVFGPAFVPYGEDLSGMYFLFDTTCKVQKAGEKRSITTAVSLDSRKAE